MTALLLLLPLAAAAEDGPALAHRLAEQSAGYGDFTAHVEMILTTAQGKETRRQLVLSTLERADAGEGDWSLLVFDSPADVRGTALLSHPGVDGPDQQWLFLPALGRAQRIAGAGQTGAFVGSEFSYEDIGGATLDKYTWVLEGTAPCGAGTCYTLQSTPRYAGSGYASRRVWLDRSTLLPQRIEFYDLGGAHAKTLTYSGYQQVGGRHWRATDWTMVNEKTGRSTTLRFTDLRCGTGLDAADFAPTALR